LIFFVIVVMFMPNLAAGSSFGDECNWTGSASTRKNLQRGVTPVYLRCSAGKVKWMYPRGALRVLLRLPGDNRDFRACIKLRPDKDNKDMVPARLFLEGPRGLLPLYSNGDEGGMKSSRCFDSKNGHVAIYVEALDSRNVDKRVAEFDYDLQVFERGQKYFDPEEECRPCSEEELAHAFCTSDLVTRGVILGIDTTFTPDTTEMTIQVTKMIRQTITVYDDIETEEDVNSDADNEINSKEIINYVETPIEIDEKPFTGEKIPIIVSKRCAVSHGLGEFVFMARKQLGDLRLKCAPRLSDWALIVHKLEADEKAHCVLKS